MYYVGNQKINMILFNNVKCIMSNKVNIESHFMLNFFYIKLLFFRFAFALTICSNVFLWSHFCFKC